MPLVVFFAFVVLLVIATFLSLPLLLVQRYRLGTRRRPARRWVATVNIYGGAVSLVMFCFTVVIMNMWVPRGWMFGGGGVIAGTLLGLLGLFLNRWEMSPHTLHFTPSRFLVLTITLIVTSRIIYGFWRGWRSWGERDFTWVGGSLAAGGVIIGYYLVYWIGVRRRIDRYERLRSA